jgi:hypothetical protein
MNFNAVVENSNTLRVDGDIPLPPGTIVIIRVEGPEEQDEYGKRLSEYYKNATPEMLQEELDIYRMWEGTGPPVPEEPWW